DLLPPAERFPIAGLLIAAVAAIAVMEEGLDPQAARHFHGRIGALVVDQDHTVDDVVRQLLVGSFERHGGVVCRHHDADAVALDHLVSRAAGIESRTVDFTVDAADPASLLLDPPASSRQYSRA